MMSKRRRPPRSRASISSRSTPARADAPPPPPRCAPRVPRSWEEAALERAKQVFATSYRTTAKSLERATADRIMTSMLGSDRRFR
jgi:hypothetical protein